jgi:AAA domain
MWPRGSGPSRFSAASQHVKSHRPIIWTIRLIHSLSLHGRKRFSYSFPVRKESLKYVLAYNTTRKLPEATPRTLQLPLDTTKVITLIGIRRSGKTYILYETMRRLESHGVDRRQMVYLNFEDDRLLPIKTRELGLRTRRRAARSCELSVDSSPDWFAVDDQTSMNISSVKRE